MPPVNRLEQICNTNSNMFSLLNVVFVTLCCANYHDQSGSKSSGCLHFQKCLCLLYTQTVMHSFRVLAVLSHTLSPQCHKITSKCCRASRARTSTQSPVCKRKKKKRKIKRNVTSWKRSPQISQQLYSSSHRMCEGSSRLKCEASQSERVKVITERLEAPGPAGSEESACSSLRLLPASA